MRRLLFAALGALAAFALPGAAEAACPAQTTPAFTSGGTVFGRLAAQWNQYFGAKSDTANGCLDNPTINNPAIVGGTATGIIYKSGLINANLGPLPTPLTGTVLQIGNADGLVTRAELDSFGAASFWTCRRADNTNAAPIALVSGDEICSLNVWGYDGTAWQGPAVAVRSFAAENWSTGHRGTELRLATTPVAGTALTDRWHVGPAGGFYADGLTAPGIAGYLNAVALQIGNATQTFPGSGVLVGLSDTQTLTNKTISCASNTCTNLPSAPVSSVFTRTGAVVATAGDYTADKVTACPPVFNEFTSGTNATYTVPTCNGTRAAYVEMELAGGGGGGNGNGTSPGTATAGGDTCFNTSGTACTSPVFKASGGAANAGAAGTGNGTGTAYESLTGEVGGAGASSSSANNAGGTGGCGPFRNGAGAPASGVSGGAAAANSGCGGAGAGGTAALNAQSGGSGPGGLRAILTSPAATYVYTVGTAGVGSTAGTGGNAGGNGGTGYARFKAAWQ